MSSTNTSSNEFVAASAQRRWAGTFMMLTFLTAGIMITLLAFSFLNLFIQKLVDKESARVTEVVASNAANAFENIEHSLNMAATSLTLSGQISKNEMMNIIRASVPGLQKFNQIVVLYPKQGGGWMYFNLLPLSSGSAYKLEINETLINDIIKKKFFEKAGAQFISPQGETLPYVNTVAFSGQKSLSPPYLIMQAVTQNKFSDGLIIALGTADSVFDSIWKNLNQEIEGISLKDVVSSYSLIHFGQNLRADHHYNGHVYEFKFAGRDFELSLYHAETEKIALLKSIPYFLLIFGFVLMFAGMLYFASAYRQASRLREINDTLAFKNRLLEQEAHKREHLSSAFKQSEEQNRSVIDSVSDIIFETDTDGKILFLNATWIKITGFDVEQSRDTDLFNMVHPHDQEKQRRDFVLLVKGQKQPYRSFSRLRTADGSFRSVEISFSMLRQDERKNLRVVGAITDVEERRRAERALGEAEKKYRAIVENAAGGIFQLTPEGIYLSANPALARILGFNDPDDLLRSVKNANENVYYNPREREFFLKELSQVGAINNYETQVSRKDGTRIWVNENIRVVRDDQGSVLFYEGSLEDITQRKEAEMGLREATVRSDLANRAKSEFLANMSHELRTPLNSIIGFSEIIKTEAFGPVGQDSYKEYADDIYQSGRRLLTIINEILDISKVEAGDRHLNEQVVDLAALVESTMNLLESKARANNLIVTSMLKNVPKIVGEELALKQVLVNILSNAIKFTPSGGRVTVTNERDAEGALRISITDTGIGLDAHEIEKALSPFGQVENAFNRANAGTGLGLTLSDALIKLHDGRLELLSQKGIGTTVTIVIPLDRVDQQSTPTSAPSASASTDSQQY
jgi:PAS domain S-box-containing protein